MKDWNWRGSPSNTGIFLVGRADVKFCWTNSAVMTVTAGVAGWHSKHLSYPFFLEQSGQHQDSVGLFFEHCLIHSIWSFRATLWITLQHMKSCIDFSKFSFHSQLFLSPFVSSSISVALSVSTFILSDEMDDTLDDRVGDLGWFSFKHKMSQHTLCFHCSQCG